MLKQELSNTITHINDKYGILEITQNKTIEVSIKIMHLNDKFEILELKNVYRIH